MLQRGFYIADVYYTDLVVMSSELYDKFARMNRIKLGVWCKALLKSPILFPILCYTVLVAVCFLNEGYVYEEI